MSHAFIFIGRSGCGKGTQAELLKKFLASHGEDTFYVETGDKFRSFISEKGYVNKLSHDAYLTGKLQPSFLACHMWTAVLLESYTGTQSIIFDGVARTLTEAHVIKSALEFFGFVKPMIIHINVSRDWSRERLKARKRSDDVNPEEIEKRLNWFENDTVPALKFFANDLYFAYFDVNGEQAIEAVNTEFMEKVSPLLSI